MHDDDATKLIYLYPQEQCSFAMHYGGRSLPACTHISTEPLFYDQYSGVDDEEDDIFNLALIAQLEEDIENTRRALAATEAHLNAVSVPGVDVVDAFIQEGRAITSGASLQAAENTVSVAEVVEFLAKSKSWTCREMIGKAREKGVVFEETNQITLTEVNLETNQVLVRESLVEEDKTLAVLLALRRMLYPRRNPLDFHPDVAVLANRAQVCDDAVFLIKCAWELSQAGNSRPLARIYNTFAHDLVKAFAREVVMDPSTLHSGKASLAAFEMWFLSERCRGVDRKLVQKMLSDYAGYYFNEDAEISRQELKTMLNFTGKMPVGRNYLEDYADLMIRDPVFSDVRDRANSNFIWFIKFERGFATEESLELEDPPLPQSATILPFKKKEK